MVVIAKIKSMRLLRTGVCFLGLTLPLVGGGTKAESIWEFASDNNQSVAEKEWLRFDQVEIAEKIDEEVNLPSDNSDDLKIENNPAKPLGRNRTTTIKTVPKIMNQVAWHSSPT